MLDSRRSMLLRREVTQEERARAVESIFVYAGRGEGCEGVVSGFGGSSATLFLPMDFLVRIVLLVRV
jgi:hypothetical protein